MKITDEQTEKDIRKIIKVTYREGTREYEDAFVHIPRWKISLDIIPDQKAKVLELAPSPLSSKIIKEFRPSFDMITSPLTLDVETDSFPYENDYFDGVLCQELIEHLIRDPMHMMSEINRITKKNGWLFLTTPNIASLAAIDRLIRMESPYAWGPYTPNYRDRHNREYTFSEIKVFLENSGYEISTAKSFDIFTRPRLIRTLLRIFLGKTGRGELIFTLSKKTRPVRDRFPESFYNKRGTKGRGM